MKKRTLGKSGLEVSAIGFGCMGLDYAYSNKLNKTESIHRERGYDDLARQVPRWIQHVVDSDQCTANKWACIWEIG